MKFSSIFAVAFAIVPAFSAAVPASEVDLAAPVLDRRASSTNGAVILQKGVDKSRAAVDRLDKAILTVKDPNAIDLGLLLDAASNLIDTLNNQTTIAKKAPKLDEACSDYVQYFVAKLITSAQKLGKDTIAAKAVFVAAGLDQAVPVLLGEIQTAADAFADVLITKVPASRKALATKDKAQVDAVFTAVNKAFAPAT